MAILYSILFKSEYTCINDKIDAFYTDIKNACFCREIWICVAAVLIALA